MARCTPAVKAFGKHLHDYLSHGAISRDWWTHGGCWTLAQALHEYFGDDQTELWGVGSPFTGIAYHVAVKVGDCFLDGNGASSESEMISRWKKFVPMQIILFRRLSDREKEALLHTNCEGPSVEEMGDRLVLEFGSSELLWQRFFSKNKKGLSLEASL